MFTMSRAPIWQAPGMIAEVGTAGRRAGAGCRRRQVDCPSARAGRSADYSRPRIGVTETTDGCRVGADAEPMPDPASSDGWAGSRCCNCLLGVAADDFDLVALSR
jgi:hypothetical protein